MNVLTGLVSDVITRLADAFGTDSFIVQGTVAVILVSLICGSVGALVVGNRMAFFSDALAHCSFAGVALGIIATLLLGAGRHDDTHDWLLPLVMTASGIVFGVGIAYVREKTNLASDTVIGVFFAGAVGLGALLFGALRQITNKNAEVFLFGSINYVTELDLLWLTALAIVTGAAMVLRYNQLVFASFNPSLARSRRIPLRLYNYLFIVLLALIVNICLQAVGILLINAMLIVPAATAINLSRNLRQMYWWTILLSLLAGLGGILISVRVHVAFRGVQIPLGTSGCIVLLSVLGFAVSMLVMLIGPRTHRQLAPYLPPEVKPRTMPAGD